MKKTILFIFVITFEIGSLVAQNSCSKYYPMEEGASFEYTLYNKKGKVDGTTNHSIKTVKTSGEGTSATFHIDFSNAKGKKELTTEYDITCTGTGIKIDFLSLMPSEVLSQYEDMDIDIDYTGTDIELPNELNTGQELKNANVTMKMNIGGMNMDISVVISNRKVEKRESITTTAGTFDCYQLSETIQSQSMGANLEILSKTWLSEGIGMIKNETYKKNGDLMSKNELTKFSK